MFIALNHLDLWGCLLISATLLPKLPIEEIAHQYGAMRHLLPFVSNEASGFIVMGEPFFEQREDLFSPSLSFIFLGYCKTTNLNRGMWAAPFDVRQLARKSIPCISVGDVSFYLVVQKTEISDCLICIFLFFLWCRYDLMCSRLREASCIISCKNRYFFNNVFCFYSLAR